MSVSHTFLHGENWIEWWLCSANPFMYCAFEGERIFCAQKSSETILHQCRSVCTRSPHEHFPFHHPAWRQTTSIVTQSQHKSATSSFAVSILLMLTFSFLLRITFNAHVSLSHAFYLIHYLLGISFRLCQTTGIVATVTVCHCSRHSCHPNGWVHDGWCRCLITIVEYVFTHALAHTHMLHTHTQCSNVAFIIQDDNIRRLSWNNPIMLT